MAYLDAKFFFADGSLLKLFEVFIYKQEHIHYFKFG